MTTKINAAPDSKKNSRENQPAFELDDCELDMVVGGINPQPLPPRHIPT